MNPCEQKLSNNLAALRAEFNAYKEVMDEREKLHNVKFDGQEKAVAVAQQNTREWQANSNEWRKAMDDRERNFLSKGMGYVIGALSAIALLLTIMEKIP